MDLRGEDLERMAEKALLACLERVPFLKIEAMERSRVGGRSEPDLSITVMVPDGRRHLLVAVNKSGTPQVARKALESLSEWRGLTPGAYGVFMAPYISEYTADLCAGEGAGYADFSGNCRLAFGQVFIEQTGRANKFIERAAGSLYSRKATRVLRVLLVGARKPWRMADLAAEADVSLGHAAKVKKLLNHHGWIREEPGGFVLRNPEALLRDWAQNYRYRKNRVHEFYSPASIPEIEYGLGEVCAEKGIRYALAGFSAAARLAFMVKYQRVMGFVEGRVDDVASAMSLKRVPTGPNVFLMIPYDEGVFYDAREVDSIQIASPIQVYLDLASYRGRGEEAAEAVLEQVIRPSW
jgi:hypothetical protein